MKISGRHIQGMGGANRSIRRQKKRFVKLGLPEIEHAFNGTINIDTSPINYSVRSYDYYFKDVVHKGFPFKRIEDFGFIEILELFHKGKLYKNWGYIYFAKKSPYSDKSNFFELVGKKIDELSSHDTVEITVKDELLKELNY